MPTTIDLTNSWTWLVTDIRGKSLTLLNKLFTDASIDYVLNATWPLTGTLPSDNPEVNIPSSHDGYPFVSFNNRLIYGLRREAVVGAARPYTCRYAGIISLLEDEATADEPVTHLTAYDAWQWLMTLPVVTPAGDLLGKSGYKYVDKRADEIALDVLANSLAVVIAQNPTNPNYIDAGGGTIDHADVIPTFDIQQNAMVGEVWTQLVDGGWIDIVLSPIYDPASRPGVLSVLNIHRQAGSPKPNAVFAWDKAPRSLTRIDRLDDGTQMANVAQFYANGLVAPQQKDAGSIADYGQYWAQTNYPPPSSKDAVGAIALAQVYLRRRGKRTLTIDPAPERAPDPFTEWFLGDQVPVWAGRKQLGSGSSFRYPLSPGDQGTDGNWTNAQRVYGFTLGIAGDEVETVTNLLLTDSNAGSIV